MHHAFVFAHTRDMGPRPPAVDVWVPLLLHLSQNLKPFVLSLG
jgi:hypothetical protein